MQVITIGNYKGGGGKSTLAIHLAHYALEQDLRVLFIDMDPKGSSSRSLLKEFPQLEAKVSQMLEPGFKLAEFAISAGIRVIQGDKQITNFEGTGIAFARNLAAMKDDWDLCVIDTSPSASFMQVLPLSVADYVLSPVELSEWLYRDQIPFLNILKNLKAKSSLSKPKFLGLLPSRVARYSNIQSKDFNDLAANSDFRAKVFSDGQYHVPMKDCYLHTAQTGQPIWYIKDNLSVGDEVKKIKEICAAVLTEMDFSVDTGEPALSDDLAAFIAKISI